MEEQFLLHKANGDLEKASLLGKKLAQQLLSGAEERLPAKDKDCGCLLYTSRCV